MSRGKSRARKARVRTSSIGQPLRDRGLRTRQKILEVIAGLIEQHGPRGLKLADVAEGVGFSPPAFYQYFRDMDEAILALCEEIGHQIPGFPFPEEWGDGNASRRGSRPFVEKFLEYWDAHRAVLWSRNVAVYAGDPRYREIRDEAYLPLMEALMARIEVGQREGLVDPAIAPRSLAAILIVMLDRIGMLSSQMTQPWGDRPDDVVDAVAYVFDRALGVGDRARPDRAARAAGRTRSRRRPRRSLG
ncbi:MAG TPA: TetR/AcrR family transcriptional regulator [Myxococcota bacterium]|nr:TetR/AcrR family transcriptional regulator [Myxococcota bacterium]